MIISDCLYKVPKGVSTRWASSENFKAEKGNGGKAGMGRKGSAKLTLVPGDSRILPEEKGTRGSII